MSERKPISKNKKLKFLYQLMPQYYDNEDEAIAMDKLKKAIYQDTKRSSTIRTKLMKMEFDVERYSEKQIFLFYLTYLQFVHTDRPLFIKSGRQQKQNEQFKRQEGRTERPNQQLIRNVQKFDMDYRFREVGIQFLMNYNLYQKLESMEDDKQFVEAYNEALVLMHLQVKEHLRIKGEKTLHPEELEERIKQFKQEAAERERLHISRYYFEESEVDVNISAFHKYNQMFSYKEVLEFAERQLIGYDKTILIHKRDKNWDSLLYSFMFSCRYFVRACEALTLRGHLEKEAQKETALKDFSMFLDKHMNYLEDLAYFVREKMRTNILLDFGGRMLFLQEQNHYVCQIEALKGLLKEYQDTLEGQSNYPYSQNPEQLDDAKLDEITATALLDLIVPEESKRPKSLRKHINEQVRDIIQVLDRLREPYGIYWHIRDSNFVRSMHEELYQYNMYSYKDAKGYSGIIKHIKKGMESPGEMLLLKEKQVRGLFRIKSFMYRYPAYVEDQEKLLKHMLQIFSSFEHEMES